MSKLNLTPNASGTGTLTVTTPNTNSDYTLTIPAVTGTINTTGAANEIPLGSNTAPGLYFTGDTNTGIFSPGADQLTVVTGGVAAITVSSGQRSTFPTTIGVGGATPSTSGSGISFPATQSASTDANTLDDYEEGTWTPTANNVTVNSGSPTYSGTYTKIGNIVYVQMYQSGGNITLASNTFFGGLPFNVATNNTSPGAWSCIGTNKSGVQYVYESSANLYVAAGISTLTNLTGFRASAVYKV